MIWSRRSILKKSCGAGLGMGLLSANSALAQTHFSDPDPIWLVHADENPPDVDHSLFASFLEAYLVPAIGTDIPRVNYKAALTKPDGLERLGQYINLLSETRIDQHSPDQQLAFWANLYNAVTVRLILDHYPVESIRDIGGFFSSPWSKPLVHVLGRELTLDEIEHDIMRARWRDPLIHYIVNCASVGCPEVPPRPLSGATIKTEMVRLARTYVNHPRAVQIQSPNEVTVSSIYHWYEDDFQLDGGVIPHILKYADAGLRHQLEGVAEFHDHTYDWSLNETI